MAKKYKIKFPVGDWHSNTHKRYRTFLIQSNLPVEVVRETHHAFKDKYGIDIGDFCRVYKVDRLTKKEFNIIDKIVSKEYRERYFLDDPSYNDMITIIDDCDHMKDLWLECLNHMNPALDLKEIKDDTPFITYPGTDEKFRTLKSPGVGLFRNIDE